ncbi:glycosyltransferase family 2 protein [Oryzihumus leptocrescens]|uniref:Glycosyltransferase 2-like domain-containing protein n=1 Tax=Oryzihumus leptocrescens TaxID=297536 RepID=A0A542ZI01_9MICO|nr:glycosyltransferase family 2 protein [Oryzihumus leptocrescens]TQL59977.1 hypothetical protein FB474_1352 [Oryzihumus leptocrescens]
MVSLNSLAEDQAPAATVVVVSWNRLSLLATCIESLRHQDLDRGLFEILVVDNASTDGTAEWLNEQPDLRVIRNPQNRGFAGAMSQALAHVRTPYLAMLNNDAVASPAWLRELLNPLAANPAVGATTAKILLSDAAAGPTLQSTGVVLDSGARGSDRGFLEPDCGQYDGPDSTDVFGFCGGAAAIRTSAARNVGGFWSQLFLYYEDVDLSWRLRRAGYVVHYVPTAVATHAHGASTEHGSPLFYRYNLRNRIAVLLANGARSQITAAFTPAKRSTRSASRPLNTPKPTKSTKARSVVDLLRLMPAVVRRRLEPPGWRGSWPQSRGR